MFPTVFSLMEFPRTTKQLGIEWGITMLKEWLAQRGRVIDAVFSLEITDDESM